MKNNAVVANSRDVAAYFEKEQGNILRDIDNRIEQGVLNVELAPYINAQNYQSYRALDMARHGFSTAQLSPSP
ncbi:hypothetical protein F3Y30_12790 [Sinorhizobium sp. BG8]|nr:hypothetical protein F3Y30_12790 [Sinorhizobium sp. BG8]